MLTIGQFLPTGFAQDNPNLAISWVRELKEEGTWVTASIGENAFELNIQPAISVFSHHLGKRLAASVYFEIAAKYAEKVGGEIIQRANVVGCQDDGNAHHVLWLATYPHAPLSYNRICNGFKAVLLGSEV